VQVQLNPLCPHQGAVADRARALGYQVTPRQTHVLDLRPGLDALRRGYHATKRNQLGKPLRVPSRISCTGHGAGDPADLDAYFDVYADSLRRWGRAGGFPYPRSLFQDLLALFELVDRLPDRHNVNTPTDAQDANRVQGAAERRVDAGPVFRKAPQLEVAVPARAELPRIEPVRFFEHVVVLGQLKRRQNFHVQLHFFTELYNLFADYLVCGFFADDAT
jgi:hypothetical protein